MIRKILQLLTNRCSECQNKLTPNGCQFCYLKDRIDELEDLITSKKGWFRIDGKIARYSDSIYNQIRKV